MKMARDGRLCKPHRRDWHGFLRGVIPDHVWQQMYAGLRRADDGSEPDGGDRRRRWTGKQVVLCWILIGWSIQGQLTERFREGRELLGRMFYRRRRCGSTYQGLIRATRRMGSGVLVRFWDDLRQSLPRRMHSCWTWWGWTVFAVDGSRVDAPRTRRNQRALGQAGRDKTHPQWWVTRLIHLPTKLMWDWRQGPGHSSERAHLREMIPSLPSSSLLVADIGFGGFDLLSTLSQQNVSFLIRCGGCTTLLVEQTRQHIERQGEVRFVYLWPTGRRRHRPLCLRLIVLKRRGKRVYLLTNVQASTRLSRGMAAELYQARWGIEVEYRSLKQTLGRRKVLAQTPEAGGMELAANILAQALVLLHAALVMGARVTRASVAGVLRALRRAMERTRYGASCKDFNEHLLAAVLDDYVRRKSKRARDWPHKKNDPPPGAPKLRRLRTTEKARMDAVIADVGAMHS